MAALKLSGAQVSTAPTASFPLFLPQEWACSRHPHGGHRCPWATCGRSALGSGLPHAPPSSLASVGLTQDHADGRAEQAACPSSRSGPWEKAERVLKFPEPHCAPGPAGGGGCLHGPQACPGLGPPSSGEGSPPAHNLRAQFALPCVRVWTCTHYFGF